MRALAASAYRHGAKFVDVGWFDPHVKRARIEHARRGDARLRARRGTASACSRSASSAPRASRCPGPSAPGLLADLDPVAASARDRLPAVKEGIKVVNDRTTNWTIAPCPTPAWAELVFPDLEPRRARSSGSSSELLHVLRLDEDDPIAAWRARADTLVGAAERLTERRFDALHYEGPGTDLTIGLLPVVGLAAPRASRPSTGSSTCRTSRPRRSSRRPTRSAPTGTVDVDQAARADRRHGRARPRRALRGRPRRRDAGVRGRRDAARRSSAPTRAPRASARSRSSTARAASARSARSSTTRCSTRTPRATSRSARASRSCSTRRTASASNESEIHIDFMIGSNELDGHRASPRDGERVPVLVEGRWQI